MAALRRNGLSSSIGVAMFPNDGTDGQTLFFAADEALYAGQAGGQEPVPLLRPRPLQSARQARRRAVARADGYSRAALQATVV